MTLPAFAANFVFIDGDDQTTPVALTGGNTFTTDTGVDATVSGVISGTGSLSKVGAGTLVLSGNNTYSGGTEIAAGILKLMHNNALGTGAVTFNGGSLALFAAAPMTLSNDMVFNAEATLDTSQDTTLSGILSGTQRFFKAGGSSLTLSGSNTNSGGITLTGGGLRVENDHALGTGLLQIAGYTGGTLAYADGVTIGNNILSSANTTFRVDSGSATQSGTVNIVPGWMVFMSKWGAGELVVTGSMNVGMGFTIQEGTLTAGAANVLDPRGLYTPSGTGVLKIAADQKVGAITGTGTVDLTSRTLTIDSPMSFATFSGKLKGDVNADLKKTGVGAVKLSGDGLDYFGRISLEQGGLIVDGNFAGTPVFASGGQLSGTGQLGDVFVDAATLSGTGGSTLSMRDLTLTANSIVEANLGTENMAALFDVGGDIVLDGTLKVNDMGGFGPGTYRLFDYAGALDDRGLEIGAVPNGYDADNLTVQTAVGGEVNLVADDPDYGPVVFWDGDNAANWDNNRVDGGNGRWKAGGRTFTDANGILNGRMNPQPGFAVFDGTAGRVVVDTGTGQVQATGMQFATDGYVLTGDMLELVAGDAIIRVGDGTAAGAGYTATISNQLDGAGKLVKTDLGTLVLEGDTTYWGGTEVRQGTLRVNGVIGDVAVAADGRLGGTGTVGNAEVSGTLAAGSSIGMLSVDGDLTMKAGSVLEVEVDADGNSDRVDVTGIAHLDGGRIATLASGGDYADQTTYTILTAEGGIDGTFADVTSNLAFLDAALSYGAKDVALTLSRNGITFKNISDTQNQKAAGGGVEDLGAGSALYDRILTFSAEDARFAFDRLSGEIHASAKSALLNDSRLLRDAANTRLRSAFGSVGATNSPVAAYGKNGFEEDKGGEALAFWSQALGSWAATDGDGNAAGTDVFTGGLLMGADAAIGDHLRGGLFAGYTRTSFSAEGRASSGSSDNYHIGAFGGGQWGAFGMRGGAAYTWNRIDTSRDVTIPGFSDSLDAKYDGGTAQVFGEAGYKIDTGVAAFEPFANLAYANLHTRGFSEDGGAAALEADGKNSDATFTTLGVRAEKQFTMGTVEASARGMLGWRHVFGDVTPGADLAFAGGETFTVAGVPIARNAAVVELGLDFVISPQAMLGITYAGQFASDTTESALKADLNVSF